MKPAADYRERVYGTYVHARGEPLAPRDIAGLAPRGPYLRGLIRNHFPSDRSAAILDLGCGHGALIHFARLEGYANVDGIDASPEQMAAAVQLGIDGVRAGDLLAELAEMSAESRDVVVTFDVLEHFSKPDVLRMTDGIHRVLRKGGRWIIHTPNGESPFGMRSFFWDFTHEVAFTRESIRQVLLSSGFADVQVYEDVPPVHGFKSALRRLLWKLIRLGWRMYSIVETGSGEGIFSQNLLAIGIKRGGTLDGNSRERRRD